MSFKVAGERAIDDNNTIAHIAHRHLSRRFRAQGNRDRRGRQNSLKSCVSSSLYQNEMPGLMYIRGKVCEVVPPRDLCAESYTACPFAASQRRPHCRVPAYVCNTHANTDRAKLLTTCQDDPDCCTDRNFGRPRCTGHLVFLRLSSLFSGRRLLSCFRTSFRLRTMPQQR